MKKYEKNLKKFKFFLNFSFHRNTVCDIILNGACLDLKSGKLHKEVNK